MRNYTATGTYMIGSASVRADVLKAYRRRDTILDRDGYELDALACPHCDLWIGDPDYGVAPDNPGVADVQRVSVAHDVGACGMRPRRSPPQGTGDDFRAFAYAHLGPASGWQTAVAGVLDVSPRTVRRWCADGAPSWVYEALPAAAAQWRADAIGKIDGSA